MRESWPKCGVEHGRSKRRPRAQGNQHSKSPLLALRLRMEDWKTPDMPFCPKTGSSIGLDESGKTAIITFHMAAEGMIPDCQLHSPGRAGFNPGYWLGCPGQLRPTPRIQATRR